MVEDSLTSAQKAIDAYKYPPTHTYDVRTLEPRSPMKERVERILECCPQLFGGSKFLDVGASKGFFSLKAAEKARLVVSVEPDEWALATWKGIRPENVSVLNMSFQDVQPAITFNRIWIGNGHHYLYREDLFWISKVSGLCSSNAHVVIEGPTGPECPDMKDFGRCQTEEELVEAMRLNDFKLVKRVESTSYTPGRAIWNFKMRW